MIINLRQILISLFIITLLYSTECRSATGKTTMMKPSLGKKLNYTLTSATLFAGMGGFIASDYYDGSVFPTVFISTASGILGGLIGYPRSNGFSEPMERIMFPVLHAAIGAILLGTTGLVIGWEYFDKPKGYDIPSYGLVIGGLAGVGGGILGGTIGFSLATKF